MNDVDGVDEASSHRLEIQPRVTPRGGYAALRGTAKGDEEVAAIARQGGGPALP